MGFVSADESPNRIPATVPYTAAFIERPPELPKASSRTESSDEQADRDRPLGVGRVLVPTGRVAEVDEQAEPDDDHDGADHLATAHVLLRQEVAERQSEHDGRDEQRLDDREASAVERAGLEQVSREQRQPSRAATSSGPRAARATSAGPARSSAGSARPSAEAWPPERRGTPRRVRESPPSSADVHRTDDDDAAGRVKHLSD